MTNYHNFSLISLLFLISMISAKAQETKIPAIPASLSDTVILLEVVTVEAFQYSTDLHYIPGSLSLLDPKGINPSDGTNLANALNSVPGITMQSGTYATNRIVIRGMGSRTPYNTNRIRSYLNDIPLTSSDGVSSPEDIDIQSIGRLEVIKGPASAIYGSGLGGSLNIYTPVVKGNEAVVSSNYGSFNTWNSHLSGAFQKGNTALWAGLGHLQSDGYRENNQYQRTSFLSTAKWKHKGWEVNPLLMIISADAGIPSSLGKTMFETNPKAAAPAWLAAGGYKKYSKLLGGVTVLTNIGKRAANRFTVFGKGYDGFEKRPFNNLTDNVLTAGIRERVNIYFDRSDWVIGTEWITEQYKWKLEKDGILINENRENRKQINVFSTFNYRPVTKITVSFAAAANHITYRLTDLYSANGDQSGERKFPLIISPRIGINYAPDTHFAVYASAGHGFSQPSPEETLLPEGNVNQDIKSEQGFQYEIGTRLSLWDKSLEIDGAFYWIDLNDLLVTKRLTEDIFIGINAGKTRHYGLEIMIKSILFDKPHFPGKLNSILSGTFSRNRFIDFTNDGNSNDGNKLPGIPKQSVQLQFTWTPVQVFEVFTRFQFTGYQYLTDDNLLEYPGYFLADLKFLAQLSLQKHVSLHFFAGINNLTDTRYASMLVANAIGFGNNESRYYYPGLPRNVYFGVQFRFHPNKEAK